MDKGGRRIGNDRRQNNLDIIPDRRGGQERRGESDRRTGLERRSPLGFRVLAGMDRRETSKMGALDNCRHSLMRVRIGVERPFCAETRLENLANLTAHQCNNNKSNLNPYSPHVLLEASRRIAIPHNCDNIIPASIKKHPHIPRGVNVSPRTTQPPKAAKTASRLKRIAACAGWACRCATTWSV